MKMKFLLSLIVAVVIMLPIGPAMVRADSMDLSPIEQLGKFLFFDENLSKNGNQSCASCHAPEVGYVGPDSEVNAHGAVYEGSIAGRFGDRKPPTAAYGGDSPELEYDEEEGLWIGGMFWDGRATGWTLGDPLAEQAQGPFLNPMEQALSDVAAVVAKVRESSYAELFESVWPGSLDDVTLAYDNVGFAIAAYERSEEVNPFTSKYDYYLKGQAKLTGLEKQGLKLFEGKAMCSACHLSEKGEGGELPLFTDFTYDNLGIPKNMENPFTIANPDLSDLGLGGFLMNAGYPEETYEPEMGKFKVPTLRNVALKPKNKDVKAYGHNGYFKSLEEIVHFYNTRDVDGAGWKGEMWPDPEYDLTMNVDELGNLGLTIGEEIALVAFMKTLSDGYKP